jgi:hypothetical protein
MLKFGYFQLESVEYYIYFEVRKLHQLLLFLFRTIYFLARERKNKIIERAENKTAQIKKCKLFNSDEKN